MDLPVRIHPLVRLAEEAIRTYLSRQLIIEPPEHVFAEVPEARSPAGAFVCLKRAGQLRGCIGTLEPAQASLAAEVIRNAIGAAHRDRRFPPVELWEVDHLMITVDVLGSSEPVPDPALLDPLRYGVILRSGTRQSVLLPDLEGIKSAAEQIMIAREKAGVGPDDPVELRRFQVTRLY